MKEKERVPESLEIKTYNASIALEPVEKRYDSDSNRLFLLYYALPEEIKNANNWGVSKRSLPVNIKSAINKPVIIYPKNPSNPFHTKQAGNFVHPTTEEAARELGHPVKADEYFKWELGHPVKADEYFKWQEKFAVGRVVNVEEKPGEGYAWTLEITDPSVKAIMKSDSFDSLSNNRPAWTSPQILTYPRVYPEEDRTGIYDHWVVSHVILTDQPAYGFDKAALVSKCVGKEQECMNVIKTRSASSNKSTNDYEDDLDDIRKTNLMMKGLAVELSDLERSMKILDPNSREGTMHRLNMAAKAELEKMNQKEAEWKRQEAAMTRQPTITERMFGRQEDLELMRNLSSDPMFYSKPKKK